MKKLLYLALFLGFAINFSSCEKDNTSIIDNFTKTYFPEVEILSDVKDGLDHEVTLTDYTLIDFDGSMFGKLDWEEVDCTHASIYTVVPSVLVPEEIASYVSQSHPNMTIVKISRDLNNWDIELNNGLDLEFDKNFNVIEIGD